jgi:hypothetical protein
MEYVRMWVATLSLAVSTVLLVVRTTRKQGECGSVSDADHKNSVVWFCHQYEHAVRYRNPIMTSHNHHLTSFFSIQLLLHLRTMIMIRILLKIFMEKVLSDGNDLNMHWHRYDRIVMSNHTSVPLHNVWYHSHWGRGRNPIIPTIIVMIMGNYHHHYLYPHWLRSIITIMWMPMMIGCGWCTCVWSMPVNKYRMINMNNKSIIPSNDASSRSFWSRT